jgi:predicted Zn-dependent peptidase
VRVTPDAPFRATEPPPGPPVVFVAPKITEMKLKNGVRVLLVERHELPIVSVRVVASAGAGDVPAAPPGALAMAGSMLEQGTTTKSALQISDGYEALGASHGAWVDWDSGGAAVKVTTDHLDAALGLLSDVVLHPSFPPEELERLRARRLAASQQEKSSPPAIAANVTAASLFGRGHPYGRPLGGLPADIKKIDRADLLRAHAVLFQPKTCSIVVAGDVTPQDLAVKLEKAFGSWASSAPPPSARGPWRVVPPSAPGSVPHDAPRLVVVDRPGAAQSVVRLTELGVAENAPDRDAIRVMNAIFGGMFTSRINLNLREEHAYTYGASSRFDERHGKGPFVAAANVKSETTAASIGELFKEARRMDDDLVTPEELSGAKDNILQALPARFESLDSVTQALADLVVYRLPLDEYTTLPARIERVTREDVQKAARAHIHPRTAVVVVVGDLAKVGPGIEPLHLGPPSMRDAYGDPLAPAAGHP